MSEHKFRYLLPHGTNFQFVAKFKAWIWLSILLTIATIAVLLVNKQVRGEYMNWTIDFKGGTEIIVAFKDKATNTYTKVDPGTVRHSLEKAGEEVEVSDISWKDDNGNTIEGMVLRTPKYSAIPDSVKEFAKSELVKRFGAYVVPDPKNPAVVNAPGSKQIVGAPSWSGDRIKVRSREKLPFEEVRQFFAEIDVYKVERDAAVARGDEPPAEPKDKKLLKVRPWTDAEIDTYGTKDVGTDEYTQWFSIGGIDEQYQKVVNDELGDKTDVVIVQSYGVGAKAGGKLRDDAIKSIVYAIFLIMLYLAFRFDIRYAPGAAFATLHDAVMVIGVFALTWAEVSLTTVAALLTVMGYSVNETVIGFDRIRENEAKLKDKSIERIIDISINERLARTIITASTVFSTTLIMNIFGTGLVQNFAFAMNVGVIVATYSSIFLAAPIFLWISKKWYSGPAPARRRGAVAPAAKPEKAEKAEKADEAEEEE